MQSKFILINYMKKFFLSSLSFLLLSSLGISSCSKDDSEASEPIVPEVPTPIVPEVPPIVPEILFTSGTTDSLKTGINFDQKAGERTLTFSSNVPWSVKVDETRDGSTWCSVSPTNGEAGQSTIKVSVLENTTYDDRNAVIRLTYGDSIRNIFVNQKQLDALTLTTDRFEVPVRGGTITVEVRSNIDHQISIMENCKDWIHQSSSPKTRGIKSSTYTFMIDPSQEYDKRQGQIEISSGDKKEVVFVYQVGKGILTITQNKFNLTRSEQDISIEVTSNFEYIVELPSVDWISEVNNSTRAASTHTINLHVNSNTTYHDRSASVLIYDKNSKLSEKVVINQYFYEYVDLGLPSGLKWATCNVGATETWEVGDHYAWGETYTKMYYDDSTYKYFHADGQVWDDLGDISGTKYDVAHQKWGDSWRMPTKSEFMELFEECTWVWGFRTFGKYTYRQGATVEGPNGNEIFLPADGVYVLDKVKFEDEGAYYWTSTPSQEYTKKAFRFEAYNGFFYITDDGDRRSVGCSVRPVKK